MAAFNDWDLGFTATTVFLKPQVWLTWKAKGPYFSGTLSLFLDLCKKRQKQQQQQQMMQKQILNHN